MAYWTPKSLKQVHLVAKVGPAGAVTLMKRVFGNGSYVSEPAPTSGNGYAVGNGEGVHSIERTGTGLWKITLSDTYVYFVGLQLERLYNATGNMTVGNVGAVSNLTNVADGTNPGQGGVVGAQFHDWTGGHADPAEGDSVSLVLTLGDTAE